MVVSALVTSYTTSPFRDITTKPRRLGKSNHLQMKLQRQHFLLSYFKILNVDPTWVRTRDLPRDSPMLNQLSHRCAVYA